jgi:K+-transporting ATPase A subunit
MAGVSTTSSGDHGVAFLVSAGIVYEIIAAVNSSPQTTEINAAKRAPTLMKWVHIGVVQSFLFVMVAAALDPKHRSAILVGGFLAMGLMYGQYVHAKRCGLASCEEGTETY